MRSSSPSRDINPERVFWYPVDAKGACDEWVPGRIRVAVEEENDMTNELQEVNYSMKTQDSNASPEGSKTSPTAALVCSGGQIIVERKMLDLMCPQLGVARAAADLVSGLATVGLTSEHLEVGLRHRFCDGKVYARLGRTLIFVNPYRQLDIYTDKILEKYSVLSFNVSPHIYDTGARAYKYLMDEKKHQAVLVVGETGTGKTHAFGHLMHFWVETAGTDDLDEPLLCLERLIRPFISFRGLTERGNSWGSTRALFSIHLGFDEEGFISQAVASVEMLETSRLTAGPLWEGSTFEVLILGTMHPSARQWLGGREDFTLWGPHGDAVKQHLLGHEMGAWSRALEVFDIPIEDVIRILCGILLLGELSDPLSLRPQEMEELLHLISKALRIESTILTTALCKRLDVPAAEITHHDKIQQLLVALTANGAALDSFRGSIGMMVKYLYSNLLEEILAAANARLVGEDGQFNNSGISIHEIPSFVHSHDEEPLGFDKLALQWLLEAARSEILSAAAPHKKVPTVKGRDHPAKMSETISDLIGGSGGVIDKLVAGSEEVITLDGPWGCYVHDLRAIREASQAGASDEFKEIRVMLEGAWDLGLKRKRTPTVFDASIETRANSILSVVDLVSRLLRGEGLRPFLVCCMKPNDLGAPLSIRRSVLQRQIDRYLLVDIAHISSVEDYTCIWTRDAFLHAFSILAATVRGNNAETPSSEFICQRLLDVAKSKALDAKGIVTNRNVYATQAVADFLGANEKAATLVATGDPKATVDELRYELEAKQEAVSIERFRQEHVRKLALAAWAGLEVDEEDELYFSRRPHNPRFKDSITTSMSHSRLAALHAALWEMAATMREGKDRHARNLRAEEHKLTINTLQEEVNTWKSQVDRISKDIEAIQKQRQSVQQVSTPLDSQRQLL